MKTAYYYIDGVNQQFDTLAEVRRHFEMYNEKDRQDMDCTAITGYDKDGNETSTRWYDYRKNGKIVFFKK